MSNKLKSDIDLLKEEQQNSILLKNSAKSIIDKIKNGIPLENGTIKDFTIIDYYRSTDMNMEELFDFIKADLTVDEIRAFKRFYSKNINGQIWKERNIDNYFNNTTVTIGFEFDENNNIIPNSGHTLTLEEKVFIINFLKELNIPICQQTVNGAQKDLINGAIVMSDEPKPDSLIKCF